MEYDEWAAGQPDSTSRHNVPGSSTVSAEMDRRVRLQCFQQRKSEEDESFVGPSLCSIN